MVLHRWRGLPSQEKIDDINRRINDKAKEAEAKINPYTSKNYKFLMQLFSEDLNQHSEQKLHGFKEAVVNMNAGHDDAEYREKFNASRYTVLNKIDQELEMRKKKKSIIQLPTTLDTQLDMFSVLESDLIAKAAAVENRVDVEAEDIIKACVGDVGLTMDFIKVADTYLESGSNFDLNQLIHWMQNQSIPVVSSSRSFDSTFVKDFGILIAEFLVNHHNYSEKDSDNQAAIILQEAFEKPGFEKDLYEVYGNTRDGEGGTRAMRVAELLVHYGVFDDNLLTYFKHHL